MGFRECTEVAYSIVTATSVQWYNQRLAYVIYLYHSLCMAQANSAKLSIVVRSICCSKIKTVDNEPDGFDDCGPVRPTRGGVQQVCPISDGSESGLDGPDRPGNEV